MALKAHHWVWLSAHSERSAEWLAEKLKEGFDVHHLDGNHDNNDPLNLVLIEHMDHMRLHGMTGGNRLAAVRGSKAPRQSAATVAVRLQREKEAAAIAKFEASNPFANDPHATLIPEAHA